VAAIRWVEEQFGGISSKRWAVEMSYAMPRLPSPSLTFSSAHAPNDSADKGTPGCLCTHTCKQ